MIKRHVLSPQFIIVKTLNLCQKKKKIHERECHCQINAKYQKLNISHWLAPKQFPHPNHHISDHSYYRGSEDRHLGSDICFSARSSLHSSPLSSIGPPPNCHFCLGNIIQAFSLLQTPVAASNPSPYPSLRHWYRSLLQFLLHKVWSYCFSRLNSLKIYFIISFFSSNT